jgi:hypothetical protein
MAGASGSENARLLEQTRPDGSRAVVSTRHGHHHRRAIADRRDVGGGYDRGRRDVVRGYDRGGRDVVRGYHWTPMPDMMPPAAPVPSVGRAGVSERPNTERTRRKKNFQAFECHHRLHTYSPGSRVGPRGGFRRDHPSRQGVSNLNSRSRKNCQCRSCSAEPSLAMPSCAGLSSPRRAFGPRPQLGALAQLYPSALVCIAPKAGHSTHDRLPRKSKLKPQIITRHARACRTAVRFSP